MSNVSSEALAPPPTTKSVRPLRVALVLDTKVWAGTEAHVLVLARTLKALPDGAVRVSVAAPSGGVLWDRVRGANLPAIAISRRGNWDPSTALVLAKRLRSRQLDVLHVHNGRTALWGVLAVKLAGRGRCVATQHFISPAHSVSTGWKSRIVKGIHRAVENGIAHHIAISHAVAQTLFERTALPSDKVTVVHNGVDVPPPNPAPVEELPDTLRADIACVARLEIEKDIPTLIQAVKTLNARRSETKQVRCVIAGEGEEEAHLGAIIKELAVSDTVHLAGWTPRALDILRASQVAVLPSIAEPFGLAVLEAMGQKKPVIAVNVGGPPEIVREGETGLLVPASTPDAMADALETLLDAPEKAAAMGEAGYERLRDCFSAERMAQQTLAVYRQVVAGDG